jgi:hypothetical protein
MKTVVVVGDVVAALICCGSHVSPVDATPGTLQTQSTRTEPLIHLLEPNLVPEEHRLAIRSAIAPSASDEASCQRCQ